MAIFYNPNSSNSTTGPILLNTGYTNTSSSTYFNFNMVDNTPAPKEEEMLTSIVVLPEGYVGIVSVSIDQKNVPVGRTKVFPFKEFPDAKADARARKAAQQLVLKMARKWV